MGEFLRKIRAKLKMSQATFAAEVGIHQSTLAHYESGFRFPRKRYLQLILDYIDTKGLSYNLNELLNKK